jgi:hypothetical protein
MTTENTSDPAAPDTIVLIHGLWVTPRSWEHWIEHYENKGYRVLAPAYPGLEVEVEALNEDPSSIEALTIPGVVEHLVHLQYRFRVVSYSSGYENSNLRTFTFGKGA